MANPTMNWARRIGFAATAPTTKQLEFISCTGGESRPHIDAPGIRGYRDELQTAVVEGLIIPDLQISMAPRYDELVLLLPHILGAAAAGTLFDLADSVPTCVFDVDWGQDIMRYAGCKISKAVFRSSKGGHLTLDLTVNCLTQTGSIAFPSIASTLTVVQPYIHHNLVATIVATAYKIDNFEFTIDNQILSDRHFNSQSRVDLPEQGRLTTISGDFPHTTDESALYGQAVTGVAATWVYTLGATSLTFTTPKIAAAKEPINITGRMGELVHRINFKVRKPDNTTATWSITLDSTP